MEGQFHSRLKKLIHTYVLETYRLAKKYPKEERYDLISQDTRASVSVMLNYIEVYARMKDGVKLNMFETSYASLKESIYVKFLAKELAYISESNYKIVLDLKNEIGAMLYSTIRGVRKDRAA
jgi:four helix bundle protein